MFPLILTVFNRDYNYISLLRTVSDGEKGGTPRRDP